MFALFFVGDLVHADVQGTIKSASEYDYPPFCTVTPDGKADGFSVELLRASLRAVDYDVEFKVGPWNAIKEELKDGAIQVLPLVGRTPEREAMFDFTFKYLTLHGAIFVREGDTRIKTEDDLADKEIIVMKGDNAEEYVRRERVSPHIIAVETYEEGMRLLNSGKHDAVITQRLMGVHLLKKIGISKIVPIEHKLDSFEQEFSFAVRDGDKELLETLNEGLSIVMADGTYERLYRKWIIPEMGDRFPLKRISMFVVIILIIPISFIVFMRQIIKRKTSELLREITERKKTQEQLTLTENRYRTVADFTYDWEYWMDPEGKLIYVSPSCQRITGYTVEEFIGNPSLIKDIILPKYRKGWEKYQEDRQEGKEPPDIEVEIKSKSGSTVWIEHAGQMIIDDTGNNLGYRASTRNITLRKHIEREFLPISKAIESTGDAIGMSDPRGNHYYHNRAFTELFGYTAKELDAAGGPSVVYADKAVAKDVFDYIMSGRSWDGDIEMISKSGRKFQALVRADAIKDEEQNIIGLIGIVKDITDIREKDAELQKSHKDLHKLAGRLILNQEKELSRLARELHDDLTQQLAVAAIDAGAIEQDFKDLPEPVLQRISSIKDQLIKISKEVHEMSRDLHPSILKDLGLVRAVQSECRNFSGRRGIAVIFTPKNVPDNISKDIALSVYRIIQEGLSNVLRHADTKNAYVFLEGFDHSLLLTVRDTGVGFDQSRVRQQAALGLGSIRERVRLINGKFSITSSPGKGTTIEVTIPLKENYECDE